MQVSMGVAYPELAASADLIRKVVHEEEESFLRTLATGIQLLEKIIAETRANNYQIVDGRVAFELYDTFGFPLDLTELKIGRASCREREYVAGAGEPSQ